MYKKPFIITRSTRIRRGSSHVRRILTIIDTYWLWIELTRVYCDVIKLTRVKNNFLWNVYDKIGYVQFVSIVREIDFSSKSSVSTSKKIKLVFTRNKIIIIYVSENLAVWIAKCFYTFKVNTSNILCIDICIPMYIFLNNYYFSLSAGYNV